jgi:dihydrofolate reductase
MRKLGIVESLTLDGVMQAPGRPDEDPRGGFEHGGWAVPYGDEVLAREMGKGMGGPSELVLGHRTYEQFYAFWPKQTDANPFTEVLNNSRKYVASRTPGADLPWTNSTQLEGDAGDAVARLKEQDGPDLVVLGSGVLVQTLMARGLIDTYTLLIHPIVLGSGTRLFRDGSELARLNLVSSVPTTTGVVIATYEPA